jgi:hypothetical protein
MATFVNKLWWLKPRGYMFKQIMVVKAPWLHVPEGHESP